MPDFWFFLTSTALFDSLSTAIQIVIFVYLFSSPKPLANSLGFLAGTSLAYLACGLAFLYHADAINALIARFVPNEDSLPDQQYYLLQAGFGVLCLVGTWYFARRKKTQRPRMMDRLSVLLRILNPVTAFLLGAFLSITGFPASIPYLGALEKLVKALGPTGAVPGAFYYNFVYIVPMLVPLAIYLILRGRTEGLADTMHAHSQKWASILNYGITVILGLLFLADSAAFFWMGKPLLTSKFF